MQMSEIALASIITVIDCSGGIGRHTAVHDAVSGIVPLLRSRAYAVYRTEPGGLVLAGVDGLIGRIRYHLRRVAAGRVFPLHLPPRADPQYLPPTPPYLPP